MISVGPATSADLGAVLGDDEADGMVLVSCCSSAPSLAVEDGAFRLTPDDTKEGLALAAFIMARGVETVVPVWRGDLWGDGFKGSTETALVSGGVTVEPGFRYEPGQGFEDIVPALAAAAAEAGPNAAIVMFGFDETAGLLDMASAHGGLDGLAWFGTGINTQDGHINDPVRLEFLERVQFTTINLKSGDNPAWQRLQEHLSLGEAPAFLAGAYDSVMLLGATIDEVQSTDPSLVREALPRVAETYSGALDHTRLNAAGDLDSADYTYWLAGRDGATLLGWYDEVRAAATPRRHAEAGWHAADEEPRRAPRGIQNVGDHAGRGGLAVRAGCRDHPSPRQHRIAQPLGAGRVRQAAAQHMLDGRMAARQLGVADHHQGWWRAHLAGREALENLDVRGGQLVAHGRIDGAVEAAHLVALFAGEQRQAAHQGAADAEKVEAGQAASPGGCATSGWSVAAIAIRGIAPAHRRHPRRAPTGWRARAFGPHTGETPALPAAPRQQLAARPAPRRQPASVGAAGKSELSTACATTTPTKAMPSESAMPTQGLQASARCRMNPTTTTAQSVKAHIRLCRTSPSVTWNARMDTARSSVSAPAAAPNVAGNRSSWRRI